LYTKKAALGCLFLSTSVMPMMLLELRSTEIIPAELASTERFSPFELMEACLLAQIDHLTAPFATNHPLFHPYRFALALAFKSPCALRTHVHYQHGSYRQC
jgi:hypothetical protein